MLFLLLILLVASRGTANIPGTQFLNPPDGGSVENLPMESLMENRVYQLGVTVDIEWVTNMTSYNVYFWAQDSDDVSDPGGLDNASPPIYSKAVDNEEQGGFTWKVTNANLLPIASAVWYLTLGPDNKASTGAITHYFNITNDAISSGIPVSTSSTASFTIPSTATSSSSNSKDTIITTAATGTTGTTSQSLSIPTTVMGIASTESAQPLSTASTSDSPTATSPSASSSHVLQSSALGTGLGVGLGIPFPFILVSIVGLKSYQSGKSNPSIWPWSVRNQQQRPRLLEGTQMHSWFGGINNHGKSEMLTNRDPSELVADEGYLAQWPVELPAGER